MNIHELLELAYGRELTKAEGVAFVKQHIAPVVGLWVRSRGWIPDAAFEQHIRNAMKTFFIEPFASDPGCQDVVVQYTSSILRHMHKSLLAKAEAKHHLQRVSYLGKPTQEYRAW